MKKLLLIAVLSVFALSAFSQIKPDPNNWKHTGSHGFIKALNIMGANLDKPSIDKWNKSVTDTIPFSSIGVYKADSINPTAGSYTPRYDFENENPTPDLLYFAKLMGSDLKALPIVPELPTNYTDLIDSTLIITPVYLPKGGVITGVHTQMGNVTGNYVASSTGFNGVSLWYSNGTSLIKVAESANTKDNWTASAYFGKDIPFTTPYTATAGIWYIITQYNMNSTTVVPKLMTSTSFSAGHAGLMHTGSIASPIYMSAIKSNVAPLQSSILLSTIAGNNTVFYVTLY